MIGDKEILVNEYKKLRTECLEKIINDPHKCPNRVIAVIREFGRIWNKNNPEIPDVFIKLIKAEMIELPFSDVVKSALRFL